MSPNPVPIQQPNSNQTASSSLVPNQPCHTKSAKPGSQSRAGAAGCLSVPEYNRNRLGKSLFSGDGQTAPQPVTIPTCLSPFSGRFSSPKAGLVASNPGRLPANNCLPLLALPHGAKQQRRGKDSPRCLANKFPYDLAGAVARTSGYPHFRPEGRSLTFRKPSNPKVFS